jgi:hypothetical protein
MKDLQLLSPEELNTLDAKERKALYLKRYYELRKSQGLCIKCGTQPSGVTSQLYCESCHSKTKEASRLRQNVKIQNRQEQGVCINCGADKENPKRASCNKCLERMRIAQRDIMKEKARSRRANNQCIVCGDLVTSNKARCEPCNTYTNAQSVARARAAKVQAIAYLGGKCLDCGLVSPVPQVYDFHHLDPAKKDIKLSSLSNRGFEAMIPELDKCVLLCSNCHRIRHATNPSFEEQDEEAA